MSNVTLFNSGSQLPSYLQNVELDEATKNLAGGSSGNSIKRISIKGNVFRMIVNGQELMVNENRAMNVIIVSASVVGRTFYEGSYDPDAPPKAPACWSADGQKPSPDVKEPQANTCMSCPQNIKGSGQGESRACRFGQRLAVLLEGDINGDLYQLSLPATSIFGDAEGGQKMPMQAYAKFLTQHRLPIGAVVTEMRFDINSSTPKLTFSAVRPLTEDEYQACSARARTDEAKRLVTMTVAQADGTKAEKDDGEQFEQSKQIEVKPQPVKEKPKTEEKEAPVLEAEPVVAEPVKVDKKTTPEVKEDIANLLDEWDV